MKKKAIALILSAVLAGALFASQGCRSMIELRKIEEAQAAIPVEIDFRAFYSDEDGYHFPNLKWGGSFSDFQRAADYPVKQIEGYTDNGETVYDAAYLRYIILGRANDEANVACKDKDVVSFVSFGFKPSAEEETASLSEYFETVVSSFTEAFGEPDEHLKHNEDVDGNPFAYDSVFYRKTVGEKVTELQVSTVTPAGSAEPSIMSIGGAWYEDSDAE